MRAESRTRSRTGARLARLPKATLAAIAIALLAGCDDAAPSRNACGGALPLVFGPMGEAQPGSPCGACGNGRVTCASPNLLVCTEAERTPGCDAADGESNLCGGFGDLVFDEQVAVPGSACGACGRGMLVCDPRGELQCIRDGAPCPDGANPESRNACGGTSALSHTGVPASPGDRCGGCDLGTLICGAPETLTCVGGGTCLDASPDALASLDANAPDSSAGDAIAPDALDAAGDRPPDAQALVDSGVAPTDAALEAGDLPEINDCGGTELLKYLGVPARAGDPCGPCGDGFLACTPQRFLLCAAATPANYCGDPDAAPNGCGGLGTPTWKGERWNSGFSCGGCFRGVLQCATTTMLTCVGPESSVCDDAPAEVICAVPGSDYSIPSTLPPAPPDETPPVETTVTPMALRAEAIVYDPFRARIYAAVPGSEPNGNSIAVVDPATATVERYVATGPDPKYIALSHDGEFLWVYNDGTHRVRKMILDSMTAPWSFHVGQVANYTEGIGILAAVATSPGTVLVQTGFRITAYDDGVPRPYSLEGGSRDIIGSNSPRLAFASGSSLDDQGYSPLCLNEMGVFTAGIAPARGSSGGSQIEFHDGVLYSNSGVAYDVDEARPIGTFDDYGSGQLVLDPRTRTLFYAELYSTTISAYDMDTFVRLGEAPYVVPLAHRYEAITRWGRYGLAVLATLDFSAPPTLYIIRSPVVR